MSDMSNWYYKMKILTFRYLNEISGWNEVAVDNIHTNQKKQSTQNQYSKSLEITLAATLVLYHSVLCKDRYFDA